MLITNTDVLQGRDVDYIGLVYGYALNTTGGIGKTGDKLMKKTMDDVTSSIEAAGREVGADAIIGLDLYFEKQYVKAVGTAVKFS